MAKYAEWYAVELDGYLRGRMSEVDRFESVKEIMSHLSEHVDDLIEKGMSELDAERAAIVSFGAPRNAALNLIGEERRSQIGGYLSTICALALAGGIVFATLAAQSYSLSLPDSYSLRTAFYSFFGGMVIVSLLAGLVAKKVEVRKYVAAWAAGMIVSGAFIVVGPERTFANVPRSELDKNLALWKQGQDATKKVSRIQTEIYDAYPAGSSYGEPITDPVEREKVLAKIRTATSTLPKIQPSYIEVTGKLTTGYLVPVSKNGMDTYFMRQRYFPNGMDGGFKPPTGNAFPWTYMKMAYTTSPDEAIKAWQAGIYNDSSDTFRNMATQQELFLMKGRRAAGMSRIEFAMDVLLPVFGASLTYLFFVLIANWLMSKIPNLTFHSTFRRRLA